jgi:hypothetical protein
MPKNTFGNDSSQNAAIYVNKKGINELFEVKISRHESY